jgi:hypothetical protein
MEAFGGSRDSAPAAFPLALPATGNGPLPAERFNFIEELMEILYRIESAGRALARG